MTRVTAWRVLLVALLSSSCQQASRTDGATEGGAEPVEGAAAVATVAGRPIPVAAVEEELARDPAASPHDAAERVLRRELLALEAERRGYGDQPEAREATKRALARALLAREVERAVRSVDISEASLREAYEAQRDRFVKPERRSVVHVVVLSEDRAADDQPAEAVAQAIHAAVRGAETPVAALRAAAEERAGDARVKLEDLGAFPRDDRFVQPFVDAVFGVDAPGVLPAPVETEFGWHVIVVRAIEPAQEISFEEAHPTLLPEVLAGRRTERLERLLTELRRKWGVEVQEHAEERLRVLEVGEPAEVP